jgi:hypothetical protein
MNTYREKFYDLVCLLDDEITNEGDEMTDKKAWLADMERLRPTLEKYVVDLPEGQFLSQECPAHLANLHRDLVSIGYANGWFE